MHSIPRSTEPGFLSDLRAKYSDWDQLEGMERRQIRGALAADFSRICGYCEQTCVEPTRAERDNEESVDHFQPRRLFPGEWLNWLNLIFACRRCNQSKGSQWPTIGDSVNRRLALINRYEQVSEYVCPNRSDTQPLCESLFTFNLGSGEIAPSEDLDAASRSMAYRTIVDINLNSIHPSQQYLPELRKEWIGHLEATLRQANDSGLRSAIVLGFCQRDQQFSSLMLTYARDKGFDV